MPTANITVVGSLMVDQILIIDRLPDIGETFPASDYKKAPGGKGANSAISAYRTSHPKDPQSDLDLDIKVRMVGAVGGDSEGDYMLQALRDNRVDTAFIRKESTNTGMMFVMIQEVHGAKDNRLVSTIGANAAIKPEEFATAKYLSDSNRPDLIISQLELDLGAVEKLLETAGKAGIDVLLNAAPAKEIKFALWRGVTHLIVNETEAAILTERELGEVESGTWAEIAQKFLGYGVSNVVITLGAEGAFYASKEKSGHVPARKIKPVDPTGAGDTFVGAYGAEYVRQKKVEGAWDIEKAVVRACTAASMQVLHVGAQEGMPWADELETVLSSSVKQS